MVVGTRRRNVVEAENAGGREVDEPSRGQNDWLVIVLCVPEVLPVSMLRCVGVPVYLVELSFVVGYSRHLQQQDAEQMTSGSVPSARTRDSKSTMCSKLAGETSSTRLFTTTNT